jgi:hypothetical protein
MLFVDAENIDNYYSKAFCSMNEASTPTHMGDAFKIKLAK